MPNILSKPEEILGFYNQYIPTNNTYQLFTNPTKHIIITNTPKKLYQDKTLQEYIHPEAVSLENIALIKQIKSHLDAIQKMNEDQAFELNKCFENSMTVFRVLEGAPVAIVIGIYEQHLGIVEYDAETTIDHTGVVIHDFHAWNTVNDLLVDASVLKMQTVSENIEPNWMAARDHIYIYPKTGCKYIGRSFNDAEDWKSFGANVSGQ